MKPAACTNLWVVIGALLMISQQAVKAEQAELRYPPNTPVTCTLPERGKIYTQHRNFYKAKEPNRKYMSLEVMRSSNSTWKSWYDKCIALCPSLKPISPGYGWIYAGQYGKTSGKNGCRDTWINLDRKDGDRVTFMPYKTNRLQGPNQKYDYSSDWNISFTIRCSTKDYWNEDLGWAPIKPWTVIDKAARKFC